MSKVILFTDKEKRAATAQNLRAKQGEKWLRLNIELRDGTNDTVSKSTVVVRGELGILCELANPNPYRFTMESLAVAAMESLTDAEVLEINARQDAAEGFQSRDTGSLD